MIYVLIYKRYFIIYSYNILGDFMSKRIIDYINTKKNFLKTHVVTDGVHSVPINDQVITLLDDIIDFIMSLEED